MEQFNVVMNNTLPIRRNNPAGSTAVIFPDSGKSLVSVQYSEVVQLTIAGLSSARAFLYPALLLALLIVTIGCSSQQTVTAQQGQNSTAVQSQASNAEDFFVVDCLLPGRIHQLGRRMTYLTARRAIKTTGVDCSIRGGEYVAYDRANYSTSLNVWLDKAKANDPEAQTYVGEIYEKGYGLSPDYALAAKWYEKAASQGYSRAQINLGYLYEQGLGVEKDLVVAMNWYRKASGLENEDLAFASTIEVAVKAEYEDELNMLRNELVRSRAETESLRTELKHSEYMLKQGKKKLNQLKNELGNSRNQLQKMKQSPDGSFDNLELQQYEQELLIREASVAKQLIVVQGLENDLHNQNEQLAYKLKETKGRSDQLNEELTKSKQEKGELKQELAALQTQLTQSNTALAEVTEKFEIEQQKIDAERSKLQLLKGQVQTNEATTLKQIQSQLAKRDKELAERKIRIKELEKEKTLISNEKVLLQASQDKTVAEKEAQLNQFSRQISKQDTDMQKQRLRISELEKEINRFNENKINLEKQTNLEISNKDENLRKLEEQLAARETAHQNQLQKIKQYERDKQKYEQEIERIQIAKAENVIYPPPSIEILEPPFTLTRGMPTVRLRSVMRNREITGRVTAPAGLLTLNVNGRKEKLNEVGLFQSMIELQGNETLVKTTAIDKAGNSASLEFMLLAAAERVAKKPIPKPEPDPSQRVNFGSFYALIIGNQQYNHFPALETPINDARAVDKILREKYGFKTTLILNADRYTILSELNKYRAKLTEVDNLIIYYAGHGELDRVNLRGHWLPVDAEPNNTANWIKTLDITDVVNAMSASHVLVVADSCYSGAMTRTSLARLEPGMSPDLRFKWLKVMAKTRSRTVLTSGGLKPVLDSGEGGHSIFANAFLKALASNDEILEGQKLYRMVSDQLIKVTKRIGFQQKPEYAPIRHGGHESGDFFLVNKRF